MWRVQASFYLQDREAALAGAEALLETDQHADAHFVSGWLLSDASDRPTLVRADQRLTHALAAYAAVGDRTGFVNTASRLAEVAWELERPDAALIYARIAVVLARGDLVLERHARTVLGRRYRDVGMIELARVELRAVVDATRDRPGDEAWAFKEYAVFLLELRIRADTEAALEFLDHAERSAAAAAAAGDPAPARALTGVIGLNRAAALSSLGRDAEAVAQLRGLPDDQREHAMARQIEGLAAGRAGDLGGALAWLYFARLWSTTSDYSISIELALADLFVATAPAFAERALRRAIGYVERLRERGGLELRPGMLAHRFAPHRRLIALLVGQRRDLDALAVMESLQARTWRDAVAGADAAPLDPETIQARLRGREALVLLDLESESWRAHVTARGVRIDPIAVDELGELQAFARDPSAVARARRAAEILFPPGSSPARAPLVVVASGRFATLPLAAVVHDGRPLIVDRAILRAPSLAAARCAPSPPVGPPVFVGDAQGDLPYSRAALTVLAAVHGVSPRVGADVTRATVIDGAGASWLHVAVHGVSDTSGGALVLADGWLAARDVRAHGVAPAGAFLVGCATAGAADAEGWTGLPAGFLATGTSFVIATSRSVSDLAAAILVIAYDAQDPSLDPPERLARAQRAVMASVPASAWASFSAWGVLCAPERAAPIARP